VEPHTLVLELSRAKNAGDRYAFRMAPQIYNRRFAGGAYKDAELSWDQTLLNAIESLRASRRDPEVVQRLGNTLRAFLEQTGWSREESELSAAVEQQRRVVLTIRSGAAELYALPWELVALGQTMRHVGELPNVLIRYEWADDRPSGTTPERPSPRPEGGRILFAWSQQAGDVPAQKHLQAIQDACDEGHHDFDPDRDVLASASLRGLREKLAEAREGHPIAALHLLCHGGPAGSTFGLILDPDEEGAPVGIDADRLASLLAEYADMVRLVVIAACDSGNIGPLGNQMGSVAQAIHRAGVAAVIASRYPFSKKGSNEFAASFYRALLVPPCSVEDAFLVARRRLAEVDTGRIDWASVQLYAREADGFDTRPIVVRPFQGLLPLGPAQSRFFFGREKEAQEIVSDLGALVKAGKPRFLVVQGWSGTGKSSMVMAGAVPRLTKEADPSAGGPGDPGWSPGYALAKIKPGSDPLTAMEHALFDRQKRRPALLVVDQLEEIFTHAGEQSRDAFVRRLWETAGDPASGVSVIVTIRSDFIGRCGEIVLDDQGTRLDTIANDEAFSVRVSQLSREQLRETIEEPAARVGLVLPASLVNRTLREIGTALGALPLVAHTMNLLWQERRGRELTMDAYDRIGTVTGALHRHADGLVDALDEQGRSMAERLFVGLVGHEADRDAAPADTRRRLTVAESRAEVCHGDREKERCFDRMLHGLEDGRLVVTEGEGDRKTVEVAHEALIRGWARLDEWLARHGDMLRRKKELDRWLRMDRELGTLLNDKQIDAAMAFKKDYPEAFVPEAEALLKRSRRWVRAIWWTKRGMFVSALITTAIIGVLFREADKGHRLAEHLAEQKEKDADTAKARAAKTALDAADRALIVAAEERLARSDPLGAMQHLEVVQEPAKHPAWLGLALNALRSAPSAGFQGHGGPVTATAVSGDGGWLVTGSTDRTARVWNTRDVANVYTMTGHTGTIRSVAWSADGAWIATGSDDHTARVWSARNPRRFRSLDAGAGTVRQVSFGADGALLTVSYDTSGKQEGKALVWRDAIPAGERAAADPPAPKEVGRHVVWAAYSRDRTAIVTASTDGKAQVWDAGDLREVVAVPPQRLPLKGAALAWNAGDKRILTVAEDETVIVWDAAARPPRPVARFPPPPSGVEVTSFCLLQSGNSAAVGYSGGAVLVSANDAVITLGAIRADEQMAVSQRRAHDARVVYADYLPSTTVIRLATAALDGTVRLWALQLATRGSVEEAVFRHPRAILSAAVSDDGKTILTGSSDSAARLWRTRSVADQGISLLASNKDLTRVLLVLDAVSSAMLKTYALIGATGAWGELDGRGKSLAFLNDAAVQGEARPIAPRAPPQPLRAAALDLDGKRVAGVTADGTVRIWTSTNHDGLVVLGEPLVLADRERASDTPFTPVFSADGTRVLLVMGDGTARIYPTAAPANPTVFAGHGGEIVSAAMRADAGRVVAGATDGAAYVWDAGAPGQPRRLRNDHDPVEPIASVGLSADGERLLSLSEGGIARIWSAGAAAPGDGACLRDEAGRGCDALHLSRASLSPEGKWVVAVSGDHAALLWSAAAPGAPRALGKRGARTVGWSPDSTQIITGSGDHAVRIWRAADAELLAEIGGHERAVVSAEFIPDGKGAVVVSEGGEVRLWELDIADVRRHVDQAPLECLPVEKLETYFKGLEGAFDPHAVHERCVAEHGKRPAPGP
jgi:WD40 repeat protein